MNEALTLTSIAQLVGLASALALLWYRVETRISSAATRAEEKADLVALQLSVFKEQATSNLNSFRFDVAENYAKNGGVKDLESRLFDRMDEMIRQMTDMRKDFQEAILKMASIRPTARKQQ